MYVGEKIFSSNTYITYVITQCLSNGGQAEVAYAKSEKSNIVYCIKRLFSIKYTPNPIIQKRCKEFEEERKNIYRKITRNQCFRVN